MDFHFHIMLCKPVKELFTSFFGCNTVEQHKALVLLQSIKDNDKLVVCSLLVHAVYNTYVSKRHSGANNSIKASLFVEHANLVALNDKKLAPIWLKALKNRN